MDVVLLVEVRIPNRLSATCSELGSPYFSCLYQAGKPIAREAKWNVGKELRKKRTLPCNVENRAFNVTLCESRQTSTG